MALLLRIIKQISNWEKNMLPRLRNQSALFRLCIILISLAAGEWLLWHAKDSLPPETPPGLAFIAFGIALLFLLYDLRIRYSTKKTRSLVQEVDPGEPPVRRTQLLERALIPVTRLIPETITTSLGLANLRFPLALVLALIAQFGLEKRRGSIELNVVLYLVAAFLVAWSIWSGDLMPKLPRQKRELSEAGNRKKWLQLGGILAIITFILSGANRFNLILLLVWLGSLICILIGFWEFEITLDDIWARLKSWLIKPQLRIKLDGWSMAVLSVFSLAAYFRFVQLESVPYEMWSYQAEKLLDVIKVLGGEYPIFFLRNTGREPMQLYVAAATAKIMGGNISFLTLKIGTALAGLLTLPYIYLLTKELGGRAAGLAAMGLAGVGYWPNLISRQGLRYPFFPLFVAPAMYYLVRGIRRKRRNDLLLCGVATGLALNGYSPGRIIPLVVAVGVFIRLLHESNHEYRRRWAKWLVIAGVITLIIFLPLLRIAVNMPDFFLFRTLSRIGTIERPYPGPPLKIFLTNLWNGLRMFSWDNGHIEVVSIPYRPMLDWVTGALFNIGLVIVLIRYIKKRGWQDLFILLSIPLLLMPSILSLAFPGENPSPNRAAGAMVPVFALAGLALAMLPKWAAKVWDSRTAEFGITVATLGLFIVSASANYRLVFFEFSEQHLNTEWNTSDAGHVIRAFAESIGDYDTAYVVGYPYWMDTRLVGMYAGQPTKDYAIWPPEFESLLEEHRAQLLIVNPEDLVALERLRELFPSGTVSRWTSEIEGKDFLIFFIPPRTSVD